MPTRQLFTLCIPRRDDQVLLGLKKRGFGTGRWNGFGGKVMPGETLAEAAIRETREECGITVKAPKEVGCHDFEFAAKRGALLEVHVFYAGIFEGTPVETEEMRPQWFALEAIPYDAMWPDDRFWLPLFLAGKQFRTYFLFGEQDTILKQRVETIGEAC